MSYVEWLRVRNCLVGVGCTMAVLIIIALGLRIVFNADVTENASFINRISMDPGSKVSHTTLPDGTPRTLIENPAKRTTITVDGGGYQARHVTIVEPATATDHSEHGGVVSVQYNTNIVNGIRTTSISNDGPMPVGFYFMFGMLVALIVATILGAPFARENDGHLEIAVMRPCSRLELALRTVGVDLAGIALSSLVTVVALIICQLMFEIPHLAIDQATLQLVCMTLLVPFAWYALIAASTSSMKRAYGAVVGFAWPIAILVFAFGMIPWNNSAVGQIMHNVFGTLQWIDPLKYLPSERFNEATGTLQQSGDIVRSMLLESILFVVYSALAIFQWQKVEA